MDQTIDIYYNQLKSLISEPHTVALKRTSTLFDTISSPDKNLVLYGAGNIGRSVAGVLHEHGIHPAFFLDTSEKLRGNYVEGVKVIHPDDVAIPNENLVCLVTVFNREAHSDYRCILKRLNSIGIYNVYHYSVLAWRYKDSLLPHFAQGSSQDIVNYKELILDVYSSLDDERSRQVYLELAKVSIIADYENYSDADNEPAYFINEVLDNMPSMVTVADCGAYNGDTLGFFLENVGGDRLKSWHAFEPDMENFNALKSFVSNLPQDIQRKVHCYNFAVGEKRETIHFTSDGNESSCVNIRGKVEVVSVALDDIFRSEQCDIIKMDIEGYEKNALKGAKKTISRDNPILAISIYHKPDDFFAIPHGFLNLKNSTNLMRRYGAYFFDSIYYSIPCFSE